MISLKKITITHWAILALVLSLLTFYIFNSMEKTTDTTTEYSSENPVAILSTNLGDIELELFVKESPVTAGNFKKLIEEGFYDGVRFHRVIPGFMVQAGDPLSKDEAMQDRWGTGGPGYAINDEFIDGLSNERGTISMANSGPNSGGSQFFINLVDNTFLDWDKEPAQSKHPVFGKVISDMSVLDKIGSVQTQGPDRPVDEVIIEKATIK